MGGARKKELTLLLRNKEAEQLNILLQYMHPDPLGRVCEVQFQPGTGNRQAVLKFLFIPEP